MDWWSSLPDPTHTQIVEVREVVAVMATITDVDTIPMGDLREGEVVTDIEAETITTSTNLVHVETTIMLLGVAIEVVVEGAIGGMTTMDTMTMKRSTVVAPVVMVHRQTHFV
jgi:hypothetical protein